VMYAGQPVNPPLLTALEGETGGLALEWKDVWLRGLELCAGTMGFRVDALYDAEALIARCRAFCAAQECGERFDDAALQAAAKRGDRALLALLVQRLIDKGEFPQESLRRLSEYPAVAAAALFLASAD
ncbi:MAG: hypothetical protein IJ769_06750, partial [Clostridia bacterium]|nr:hypothetical protein [Clostridia bacterium]